MSCNLLYAEVNSHHNARPRWCSYGSPAMEHPHHLLHPPTRKETTCCSLQVDGPTPPYRTPGGCAPPQGPRAVVGAGAGGTAVVIGVVDE